MKCERCGKEGSRTMLVAVLGQYGGQPTLLFHAACLREIVGEWLIRRGDVDELKTAKS